MADSKLTDLTSLDSHQEEDQEREQQFMEDKKKKKEDKKKRESSQKVTEQKIKVPESSKPPSTQTPATPGSVSPSPGPAPPPSPCPAAGVAVPPAGNNAKRAAVANGQPPSSGNQPPQQQRYMPREVPPRFRCQQDQKVLLKRGQPPLSSMLLGGGSGRGATPPLHGDAAGPADPNLAPSSSSSPPHSSSSSSSVAAPTTTTTSTYANSTWGAGSGSLPPTQDWEKVIVDGSDLEEWPSILPGPRVGPEGGEGAELDGPNSSSASWSERSIQQPKGGGGVSGTGSGSSESPSPPHSSPPSSSSSLNECVPSGVAWGASSAQTAGTGGVVEGGQAATALYNSKVSPLPGSQEVPGGVSSGGGPGANFHPNTNPSAWPALGQDGTPAGVVGGTTEGGLPSSSSSITPSFSASTTHPLSSVNPPGHRPQHLLQDRPTSDAEQYWGGGPGPDMGGGGSGPNAGGADGIMDCGAGGGGGGGGGSGNLSVSSSSSSTSSSWRAMPPPSSDLNTGASKTDGWGGGGGGAQGQEGSVWGFSSHSEKAGSTGDKGWGRGNEGSSNTPAVSQGAWDGGPEGEYGSAVVRGVSGNLAKETSEGGRGGTSSNSSSSGGTSGGGGVSQDAASPTSATTTGAWDNQKQVEGGEGGAEEWGGQGTGGAGGGSRAGSGESNNQQEPSGLRHRSQQGPNAEVALQSMLSRSDLDPRVLSNTGWGQTQIRQNVAWDLEGRPGAGRSDGSGSSASACSSSTMSAGRGSAYPNAGSKTTDPSAGAHMAHINPGPGPVRDGWEGGGGAPQPGRAPPPPGANSMRKPGSLGEEPEGKSAGGGWGDVGPSEVTGKGWGSDDQEWTGDRRGGGARGNWRELGEQGSGGGGGGWGGSQEEKGTGSWKEMGRGEGGSWGQRGGGGGGGGDWGQRDAKPVSDGGWSEGRGRGGSNSDDSSWGNVDEGGPQRGWGGGGGCGGGGDMGGKGHQDWGGGKPHTAQIPNSQAASLKAPNQQQHQSPTQPPPGSMQGGWGRSGGPQPQSQNQSPGWISGPIPQIPGESLEPSGWEEPSPQSISRKMEIDDGTSAWGDPTRYNTKNVNLWDKNSASPGQTQPLQGQPQQVPPPQQQPPRRQQGIPPNRDANPASASGMGPGMWGGSSNMTGQSVDNGTAAWGQSTEPAGWGDPDDTGKAGGWRNPSPNPAKSVSKSVGEGWGKGESSVSASRNPSWEDEDDGGGVWNSAGSQGSNSSYNSVGWSQGHGGKRGNIKGGGGENWMNPMNRQFSNMGLLGEDPSVDKKLDGDRRGMSDYNGEMRRGGRGGAGGYRVPSSKDMGPGDMGPYGDKMAGHGVYGGGGGGSGGMPPPRGIPQPGMHPINPSQGLRAQVPHQFLSPQVPGPILKQMPSPGSSVGAVGAGVFPPQLSHQQIAMLSNIYPHVQQFHLACQLLLQQQQQQQQLLQNQRKFPQPQPLRQQADPQQLARIMAILQQQQRQQQGGVGGAGGGGGSSKLSPSHMGGSQSKQPMGDSLPHPGGVGGPLSDLHAKSQGMYSGLAPGGSLSGLELGSMMGGVGPLKDGGGQQSRFKWMMEGHSPAPSPPDTAHHKNGPLPNPIKACGGSPYSQYELLGGEGMGMPPQCPSDWQRTPGSKMGTKTGTSSWPPEFQPGVPWKGIPSADPESDPYMTPGSVLGSPGPASLNDSDHQLLRDHTGPNPSLNTSLPLPGAWPYSASDSPLGNAHSTAAKYSDYKPSWPPEPIGHNKPWKTNRNSSQLPRPPPGLTSQKQASPSPWGSGGPRLASSWGGGGRGSQDSQSRFGPGSAWSDGVGSRGSCWLLLSNLTPQIDGSTLRTICMQHGPLLTFHLGLTQGSALIRYSTRQEAAKAQGALHMCVLGNTTILAEFVSEEDVARYFAHSQAGGAEGAGPGVTVGSSGPGAAVASSGGSSPGSERGGGGTTTGGNGGGGGGVLGSVGSSGSGWQSLDGTMSSPEVAAAQGPGLGVFAQWSTNGAGDGGGGGMGGGESSRAGLWGGVTPGYSGSSLWGTPQMEDRHQMGSPAALLPVDLLGGGADSI